MQHISELVKMVLAECRLPEISPEITNREILEGQQNKNQPQVLQLTSAMNHNSRRPGIRLLLGQAAPADSWRMRS